MTAQTRPRIKGLESEQGLVLAASITSQMLSCIRSNSTFIFIDQCDVHGAISVLEVSCTPRRLPSTKPRRLSRRPLHRGRRLRLIPASASAPDFGNRSTSKNSHCLDLRGKGCRPGRNLLRPQTAALRGSTARLPWSFLDRSYFRARSEGCPARRCGAMFRPVDSMNDRSGSR